MKTSIIIIGLLALNWRAQLDCHADPTKIDPDQLAEVIFQNLTNACPKIDPAKLLNRSFYIAHQVVVSATNFVTLEDGLKKVFSGNDENLAILDYKNNTEALAEAAAQIALAQFHPSSSGIKNQADEKGGSPNDAKIEKVFSQRSALEIQVAKSLEELKALDTRVAQLEKLKASPPPKPQLAAKISELHSERKQLASRILEFHFEGMKRINVADCPKDFQSVWFDYVIEVERFNSEVVRRIQSQTRNEADLGELLKLGVLAYVHTNPALMALEVLGSESDAEKKRAEQRQSESHTLQSLRQRLDDSWYRLERVAMNYGVEPKR